MRILKITEVVAQEGFSIFKGVVEGDGIRTGDPVAVLDGLGGRELGVISSVAVDDPTEGSIGARMLGLGQPGQKVRVTIRRRKPAIADAAVVAVERAAVS